ncbi:MAG: hypothetical protein GX161_06385 [Firmicutes bacterium]|nr:hypothetical protein [Bacillota bacterium]
MRIGTYNILAFTGYPADQASATLGDAASPERIQHYVNVFGQLRCDILALQEGAAPPAMLHAIARELGMYLATIPSPKAWPGHVLSRYPILESRTFGHFDPHRDTPLLSRAAGAVCVEIQPSRTAWIVALHLHPSDVDLRAREASILADRIDELSRSSTDMVVLGDLNCQIGEAMHNALRDRGFVHAMEAAGGIRATFDSTGRRKIAIDHIYLSPSLATLLRRAEVVDWPGFFVDGLEPGMWVHSDHMPVIAELAED